MKSTKLYSEGRVSPLEEGNCISPGIPYISFEEEPVSFSIQCDGGAWLILVVFSMVLPAI